MRAEDLSPKFSDGGMIRKGDIRYAVFSDDNILYGDTVYILGPSCEVKYPIVGHLEKDTTGQQIKFQNHQLEIDKPQWSVSDGKVHVGDDIYIIPSDESIYMARNDDFKISYGHKAIVLGPNGSELDSISVYLQQNDGKIMKTFKLNQLSVNEPHWILGDGNIGRFGDLVYVKYDTNLSSSNFFPSNNIYASQSGDKMIIVGAINSKYLEVYPQPPEHTTKKVLSVTKEYIETSNEFKLNSKLFTFNRLFTNESENELQWSLTLSDGSKKHLTIDDVRRFHPEELSKNQPQWPLSDGSVIQKGDKAYVLDTRLVTTYDLTYGDCVIVVGATHDLKKNTLILVRLEDDEEGKILEFRPNDLSACFEWNIDGDIVQRKDIVYRLKSDSTNVYGDSLHGYYRRIGDKVIVLGSTGYGSMEIYGSYLKDNQFLSR